MEKDIVYFDLFKVNKGKEKLCKCKNPHYEIDTVNRIVMCLDCGAVMDSFDALQIVIEKYEQIEEYQKRALEKAQTYGKLANEEFERMCRNKVFRTMQENYKQDLIPKCPKCGEYFEPTKLIQWTNRKLT